MNQQSAGEMLKGKCPIIFMHEMDLYRHRVSDKYRCDKVSNQNARVNLLRYPVKRGNRKLKC